MLKRYSVRATARANNRFQAFVLLLLGLLFLLLAWLVHPSPKDYPIGVLMLGAGMLLACALNPYRLVCAGLLVTLLGVATFLTFKPLIPGNQVLAVYILAIGLALLGIAIMARRGYVGSGAVTPGLIVVAVGIIEYLLAARDTPANFIPFMLSLWLPGVGLLVLGLIYLLMSIREPTSYNRRRIRVRS
jgi:hypothetical protein